MFKNIRQFIVTAAAAGVAGFMCTAALSAQAAKSPNAAPAYDAVFDVQGQQYTGVTTFVVDKAGKVTGTMKLDNPATVNATLNGELQNGVWKFSYPFTMDNQGSPCEGTVSGTAKVTADRSQAAGEVAVTGCSPDALSGTFTFTKKK